MKQMTLWEVENDTKNENHNSDPAQIGSTDLEKMTPCVFCGVKPIIRHRIVEYHGYDYAKCPICGWGCGTHYDIAEHWNKYNTMEWRLNEKNGKGKRD